MKISKDYLRRIIKEEVQKIKSDLLTEDQPQPTAEDEKQTALDQAAAGISKTAEMPASGDWGDVETFIMQTIHRYKDQLHPKLRVLRDSQVDLIKRIAALEKAQGNSP